MIDKDKTVILMPIYRYIEPETACFLEELSLAGYKINRLIGCPYIDQARNQLVTRAIKNGFEHIVWIDSDMGFQIDQIEQLINSGPKIVAGLLRIGESQTLATDFLEKDEEIIVDPKEGGLYQVRATGAGFMYTHSSVYETIAQKNKLPYCDLGEGEFGYPFFMQEIVQKPEGHLAYIGEDIAFCYKANRAGIPIWVNTKIALKHYKRACWTIDDKYIILKRT